MLDSSASSAGTSEDSSFADDFTGDDFNIGEDDFTDDNFSDDSREGNVTEEVSQEDVQKLMSSLKTDYSKINWGVSYPLGDNSAIVISVAPFFDGYTYYLIVGVTNCYSTPVTVNASGYAKNDAGDNIGDLFFYADAIGPTNTFITKVRCDESPNGEIRWDSVYVDPSYNDYVPWEADWSLTSNDDGTASLPISIYSSDGGEMTPGEIYVMILDEKGNIIGLASGGSYETAATYENTVEFSSDDFGASVGDVAIFVNPTR